MGIPTERSVMGLDSKMTTPEKSSASPTVACGDGVLYLGWTGTDFALNTIRSRDGRQFEGKRGYAYTSYRTESTTTTSSDGHTRWETRTIALPPAAAALAGGLYLAWTGSDSHLNVMNADAWPPAHTGLTEMSMAAPALARLGDELVLAWAGIHRHLNVMVSQDRSFGGWPVRLEETTSVSPAVCAAGDELALAWTGTDRHLNIMFSQGGSFVGEPTQLEETSSVAPALCAVGDELVLGWAGTDRHINLLVSRGRSFAGEPIRLEEKTSDAPAIGSWASGLVLAWTGTDLRLNVGRLREAADE